jgi:hypothetical protein
MFQKVVDWANDPFDPDMNAAGWFLIIGLVLVSLFVWSRIVRLIGA